MTSLNRVLNSMQDFYLFSSLKINATTSEVGWMGRSKQTDAHATNDNGIKWINLHQKDIRILGINISYNDNFCREQNLDHIFESFKTVLTIWKM